MTRPIAVYKHARAQHGADAGPSLGVHDLVEPDPARHSRVGRVARVGDAAPQLRLGEGPVLEREFLLKHQGPLRHLRARPEARQQDAVLARPERGHARARHAVAAGRHLSDGGAIVDYLDVQGEKEGQLHALLDDLRCFI